LAILLLAMLANGLLATVEDDLPGGFNNPDGASIPRYIGVVRWSLYVTAALVVVACLLAVVGNAIA
jgi:hypothetical protein